MPELASDAIRKVCVVGAGVMGAGIAAQVANSGTKVLLLDVPAAPGADGKPGRNAIAEGAVAKLLATQPAAFMSRAAARLVETGNTEDDLEAIASCDWVVEAVVERLDVKQALYRRIDAVRRPGTAVSSNTSTIPLRDLVRGQSEAFARDFLITHFFNPPRHMRLIEIVSSDATDTAVLDRVVGFADRNLGKSVVRCKDSPGFIANRLGTYWLQLGVNNAIAQGIGIEDADAINAAPFGIPRTGVFGLVDLIGLDLMPHINASLLASVGPDDWIRDAAADQPVIRRMIETGLTGRKGRGGFYRVSKAPGGGRVSETMDFSTGEYRAGRAPNLPELKGGRVDARTLLSSESPAGRYAWSVYGRTLAYAARIVPEAAGSVVEIDAAMKLGYNWRLGPFEMIDQLGVDWFAGRLRADGIEVPPMLEAASGRTFYAFIEGRRHFLGLDQQYRPVPVADGVLSLDDIKRAGKPLLRHGSASLWDLGDGVACFEITSKAAAIDEAVLGLLDQAIDLVSKEMKALVITHDGKNFSVGANIGSVLFAANIAAWSQIETSMKAGQQVLLRLKRAPFPVVSGAFGMALGGGCEILLHSDAIQAYAETYAGLVEGGVGLIPGWGGCKEMLLRWADRGGARGPMSGPMKAFELIGTATVSGSAAEARENGILRDGDGITMNRDRLLADAKARALSLVAGYVPPQPAELRLPGPSGRLALTLGLDDMVARKVASAHDVTVGRELACVLAGGQTDMTIALDEDAVLDLERAAFLRLARTKPTLERIGHMLETGKPLRN